MNYKLIAIFLTLFLFITASSQRPKTPNAPVKPRGARFMVQGTYEETYQGTTDKGSAEGKLIIKYEAARWLTISTNEVGNAEFSDLANAPAPSVSGSATYQGRVQSGGGGGDSYEATSYFDVPLSGDDVVLSVPYVESGNGFKIQGSLKPKLKVKWSLVEGRNGETRTARGFEN